MDFSNRGSQQSPAAPRQGSSVSVDSASSGKSSSKAPKDKSKWWKIAAGSLLIAVAVLILALLVLVVMPSSKSESSYIDSNKLQAVFLTNDQVYFGKIDQLNSKFLVLSNIYYLRTQGDSASTNTSAASNNVSLVKLGCELHKPYDKMVINQSEVQFWENLQTGGQVATAVTAYAKQNPNNTCSNNTSDAASSSSVQGSSTPSTSSTDKTTTDTNSTSTNSTTKTP